MKLLQRRFGVGKGEGHARLVPECSEDLWHAYNLIRPSDLVTCSTTRKVVRSLGTDASRSDTSKVQLNICVRVETVDYDPVGQELRVSGPNQTECEHVSLGAYHTLTLERHKPFKLAKAAWDGFDADRLRTACDPATSADLAVLLISDAIAHLLLVGSCTTSLVHKVEASLPAKHGAAGTGYAKALQSYLSKVLAGVERHVDWEVVRCLVVAGPGFTRTSFVKHLEEEASKRGLRTLSSNRSRILSVHASTAYTQALEEVLADPGLAARIKDTAAAQEVAALREFTAMLSQDSARACYGPAHVAEAVDLAAVDRLLITDTLIRSHSVPERRRYAKLVSSVTSTGGKVLVFSGAHASGQQLDRLTGVAALLRYPLPGLDEDL